MPYLDKANFEYTTQDGKEIALFLLTNKKGNEVWITNYGARVVAIRVPDTEGTLTDVLLGFDTIDQYFKDTTYQGAAVGRFANRIANGQFSIDGQTYHVSKNIGDHILHGGFTGFHNQVWEVKEVSQSTIELHLFSPDMQEGFPGNLSIKCTYTFTEDNELIFDCSTTPDKDTVINFTQHNYFNLMGEGTGDILSHELMINASLFDELNDECICEGDPIPVENTPFDFRIAKEIGRDIKLTHEQLKLGQGYDHNYHLDNFDGQLQHVAKVAAPNGITLDILTNQPCMQLYTSNWFSETIKGKSGRIYTKHTGFCLEPQVAPNAPNRPNLISGVVRAEEKYGCVVVQRFGVRERI